MIVASPTEHFMSSLKTLQRVLLCLGTGQCEGVAGQYDMASFANDIDMGEVGRTCLRRLIKITNDLPAPV